MQTDRAWACMHRGREEGGGGGRREKILLTFFYFVFNPNLVNLASQSQVTLPRNSFEVTWLWGASYFRQRNFCTAFVKSDNFVCCGVFKIYPSWGSQPG
jgi:hypothetical protein